MCYREVHVRQQNDLYGPCASYLHKICDFTAEVLNKTAVTLYHQKNIWNSDDMMSI